MRGSAFAVRRHGGFPIHNDSQNDGERYQLCSRLVSWQGQLQELCPIRKALKPQARRLDERGLLSLKEPEEDAEDTESERGRWE